MRVFIDDGYTVTAGINGGVNLAPLEITFRPYVGRQQQREWAKATDAPDQEQALIDQMLGTVDAEGKQLTAPRLLGWSFDRKLNADALRAMRSQEFMAIALLIHGFLTPDYEVREVDGKDGKERKQFPYTLAEAKEKN